MPDGFSMYRVFYSTPGNLEFERRACHDTTGAVNENGGMDAGVLFIPVTLRGAAAAGGVNAAVLENVRDAHFFVQVFGRNWGPAAAGSSDLFEYALECRADPALPMREVAVLLKAVDPAQSPEAAEFLQSMERRGYPKVSAFDSVPELERTLTELLTAWRASLTEQGRPAQ
jgi:hypothetical protein